jgi:hypothetical protein
MGITTEITGEGGSVAPIDDVLKAEMKPFLDRFRLTIDWKDLAGYFARLTAPIFGGRRLGDRRRQGGPRPGPTHPGAAGEDHSTAARLSRSVGQG